MQLGLGRKKTTMGFPRITRCATVVSVHVVDKWEAADGSCAVERGCEKWGDVGDLLATQDHGDAQGLCVDL